MMKISKLFIAMAALISIAAFVYRGYLVPFSRASHETQSEHVYDFGVRYYSATDLRKGINPYEKTQSLSPDNPKHGMGKSAPVYFPLVMALYIPLSFLTFAQAQTVWLSLNVVFIVVSAIFMFRIAEWPVRFETVAGIVLMLAGFLPILRNLDSGQINLLILLLLVLGFDALRTGNESRAGMWLALAALVKPVPAILFGGLLLRRKWAAVISGLATWLICLMLSLVSFGAAINLSFFKRLIFSESTVISTWWSSQNLASFVLRVLWSGGGNPERVSWLDIPAAAWLLWGAGSFFICYTTVKFTVKHDRMPLNVCLCLWLIAGFLISPRTWDHYFPWMLIPVVLLAAGFCREQAGFRWIVFATMYLLLAFPAVKYSSLPVFHAGPLLLLTGSQTMGLVFLYFLLVKRNWEEAGGFT